MITWSNRLPTPFLLGLRLAARRPRRSVLSALSIAVSVAGIVAVLAEYATVDRQGSSLITQRIDDVLMIITVLLVVLAVVNALLTAWATVVDNRHASALARALGATPAQDSAGVSVAQLLSVVPGSLLGLGLGIGLFAGLGVLVGSTHWVLPPAWKVLLLLLATWTAMTALTTVPARLVRRRRAANSLSAELA